MKALSNEQSITSTLIQQLLPFFPIELRGAVELEAQTLSLSATRLGLEVLDAERRAITFSSAVERAGEYPLLGRVYYGALNLLQWQVPPQMREMLRLILTHTIEGRFESVRQFLFSIARRKDDAEAALCRFMLWAAVRINLTILTWHQPLLEAVGTLDQIEERSEAVLRELLEVPDLVEPDCRPLYVLVAIALEEACAAAAPLLAGAMTRFESESGDALRLVRGLTARDAAVFQPGRFTGAPGSQQILDRFPQHDYPSVGAIEQQRSRIRKRIDTLSPADGRLIDIIVEMDRGKP
jgi:hypothetical protein